MAKKNKKVADTPFPKTVYAQHAHETGDTDEASSWLITNEQQSDVTTGVRVGVYVLDRVVIVEKTETFKEVPVK